MKENLKENIKNVTDNLKPILDQIKGKINEEQVRETVAKNIAQTRAVLEATAKEVVRQTKESRLLNDYVRPAIESEKAEQALSSLETKVSQAAPLVAKLREYRK